MTPKYAYSICNSIAKLSGTESRLKKINPGHQEIEDRSFREYSYIWIFCLGGGP